MIRCASCLHWTRRVERFGTCAHPTKPVIPERVHEDFACSFHTPNVVTGYTAKATP